MKIGFDSLGLQSEINGLKAIDRHKGSRHAYLKDVDDGLVGNLQFSFYVMRYVKGTKFDVFIQEQGADWVYMIGYHILQRLMELHRQGWVFGDLKDGNVLIARYGQAELIDYGGVTKKGQAVKQFTELYDRGYWNLGSRKADESYDIFAFAMLVMRGLDTSNRLGEAGEILPQHRNWNYLQEHVQRMALSDPAKHFLQQALQGQISSSRQALQQWKRLLREAEQSTPAIPVQPWLKGFFAVSMLLFGATVFLLFL